MENGRLDIRTSHPYKADLELRKRVSTNNPQAEPNDPPENKTTALAVVFLLTRSFLGSKTSLLQPANRNHQSRLPLSAANMTIIFWEQVTTKALNLSTNRKDI